MLGTVAHTCNPSHSGGRDQYDLGLRPTPGKKFLRPSSQPVKAEYGGTACHSIFSGSKNRRLEVQAGPDIKERLYLKTG
jgi:hypothetical protein